MIQLDKLIDINSLQKFDPGKMHQIYDQWPEIGYENYNFNHEIVDLSSIGNIVFAGMGGSGTVGDVFSSILSKAKIHTGVIKGYILPRTIDSNTLVVITSTSGNTVEALTVLDSAKKSGCKIIAFSSGGKVQDYCTKNKINFRKIPLIHSPRASFVGFLYSMLKVLEPLIPLKKEEIKESITHLEILRKKISSSNLNENNPSLNLANWLTGFPLIYYPWGLQATAIRFKNSLQENSKMHAMTEDVIEASHNGIVSWERSSNVQPILLQGEDDYFKTKERWSILKEYFSERKIDYMDVFSVKGSILTKLVNLIYLLDYSSIYRAVISEIDPSPIRSIDYIKSKL